MSLDSLRTLPIPVPPMLEQALDYPGQARLVVFYWSSLGDEAMYADGVRSGEADWAAYLTFIEHPRVESHLRPYDLGSSEEEAQHWLVLDRETRTLSVLPVEKAAALLTQQWGTRPALPLRLVALDPIPHVLAAVTGKAGWRVVWMDGAPVAQRRREQEARLDELRTWLDRQKEGHKDNDCSGQSCHVLAEPPALAGTVKRTETVRAGVNSSTPARQVNPRRRSMRDHIITPTRPVASDVAVPQVSANSSILPPARKQTFLGTAFLAEKARKWGHRRLLALILALFVVPLLGLCVLLAAVAPFIAYFFTASGNYQPTVLEMRGFFGAPGETDAQGITHQTTLMLVYTDHLTLMELPAGDAKRATTLDTTFVQHASNPRIVSAELASMGRKSPDLLVKVSMNWQSLSPETFLYDFANHPEYLSATPETAGYTAAQFGLVTVTKEA